LIDQGVVQPHRLLDDVHRQGTVSGVQGFGEQPAGLGIERIELAVGRQLDEDELVAGQ
jgi:hypothetical protein